MAAGSSARPPRRARRRGGDARRHREGGCRHHGGAAELVEHHRRAHPGDEPGSHGGPAPRRAQAPFGAGPQQGGDAARERGARHRPTGREEMRHQRAQHEPRSECAQHERQRRDREEGRTDEGERGPYEGARARKPDDPLPRGVGHGEREVRAHPARGEGEREGEGRPGGEQRLPGLRRPYEQRPREEGAGCAHADGEEDEAEESVEGTHAHSASSRSAGVCGTLAHFFLTHSNARIRRISSPAPSSFLSMP